MSRVLESSAPAGKVEFIPIYEIAIKHSMVLIMLADTVIEDSEEDQVLEVINRFMHNDFSM